MKASRITITYVLLNEDALMFNARRARLVNIHIFLGIVVALLIIGVLFVYSASSVYALATFGSSHYFAKRQLIGIVIGIFATIVLRFVPLEYIQRFSPLLFLTALDSEAKKQNLGHLRAPAQCWSLQGLDSEYLRIDR